MTAVDVQTAGGPEQSNTAADATGLCCPIPANEQVPWLRLIIGLFIAGQTMLLGISISITPPADEPTWMLLHGAMLAATLAVMGLLGWPLLVESVRALLVRRVTMELLFLAGIGGAFGASMQSMWAGEGPVYFDVVAILLVIYALGQAISAHSRQRAISIMRSMTRGIETARVIRGTGFQPMPHGQAAHATDGSGAGDSPVRHGLKAQATAGQTVDVQQIRPGDLVRVMPGELIPVDGTIVEGCALVRQTPFTGESVSSVKNPGEAVLAGMGCEDASLVIQATVAGSDRKVDRLAELIEQARCGSSHLQRQADRLVKWFLPIVLLCGGGAFAYWTHVEHWHTGLFIALSVLLIACPCAAGLATPLALWTALGRLAQKGLILRSGDVVERLAEVDGVVFDKTGTLSQERLVVREVEFENSGVRVRGSASDENLSREAAALNPSAVRAIVSAIERCSAHPVARALSELEVPGDAPEVEVLALRTLPGRGIEAEVLCRGTGFQPVRHGQLAHATGASGTGVSPVPAAPHGWDARATVKIVRDELKTQSGRLVLSVEIDDVHTARIVLEERLREGVEEAMARLEQMGLSVEVMTGDAEAGAAKVRGLAPVTAGMTPEQKLAAISRQAQDAESARRLLFVGDGLNDAAAMAGAHVGIALAEGAETARQTAGGSLHGGNLQLVPEAIAVSQQTISTIRSNLHWAVCYNAVGIFVASMGWLNPVLAALVMAVSSAVVAWRSFSVQGRRGDEDRVEKLQTPNSKFQTKLKFQSSNRRPIRLDFKSWSLSGTWNLEFGTSILLGPALFIGLVGQGAVLALLVGLTFGPAVLLAGAFALLAWATVRWRDRLPFWSDHLVGMLSLGGLGMAIGWWADAGFRSVIQGGQVLSCCALSGGSWWDGIWMYTGMLALGIPGMYLLRRDAEPFSWRRWCCIGPLVVGVPGMCIGMWLGGIVSMQLHAGWHPQMQAILMYAWMLAGMLAGMMIVHAWPLEAAPAGESRQADISS